MAYNESELDDKPFSWIDHLHFKLAQTGYDDGLPLPQWTPATAADPVAEGFQAEKISSPAQQQAPNQADGQSPPQMPDAPSVQPGPSAGNAPVPEHLKWVNDPKLLSNYLDIFNKQNPLHPSNAPKPVADVFGSMKTPAENYSPPTGANSDASKYWFNYMGYPDQYALNKVSKESGGDPREYAAGTKAAGLGQVTPQTAREVGFNFYRDNPNYPNPSNPKEPKQLLDENAWKTAMAPLISAVCSGPRCHESTTTWPKATPSGLRRDTGTDSASCLNGSALGNLGRIPVMSRRCSPANGTANKRTRTIWRRAVLQPCSLMA